MEPHMCTVQSMFLRHRALRKGKEVTLEERIFTTSSTEEKPSREQGGSDSRNTEVLADELALREGSSNGWL